MSLKTNIINNHFQVTTNMEPPSGEPQGVSVTTLSSRELKVSWLPPPPKTHNGDLLGYYVGVREYKYVFIFNLRFCTAYITIKT